MLIDLTKDKDSLIKSFHPSTRYNINFAQKMGVRIITSKDIKLFYQLYLETSQRNHFKPSSYQDIQARFNVFNKAQKALLMFAVNPTNKPIATLLILLNSFAKQAFSSLSAISNNDRHLKASYLLHYQAMLKAKKLGYQYFDFDGILDPKYPSTKNWAGFTFFKKGFRGQEITYLGSYLKIYNPFF